MVGMAELVIAMLYTPLNAWPVLALLKPVPFEIHHEQRPSVINTFYI